MHLRFLVNPTAGAGGAARVLPQLEALAASRSADLELSRSADDLTARARRAGEEGVERLVVLGGDGTFHYAIRGLAGTNCELGLLPMGTGNDLAGVVGVPSRWSEALRLAVDGRARPFDLGELSTPDGRRIPFGIYCGGGLDSEVSKWARERPGRRTGGRFVYALGTLAVLRRFEPPRLTVEHDGGRFEGRAMFAVAAVGDRFGGGMRIAPAADPHDGLFDLVVVRELPRRKVLSLLPRVYFGAHVGRPGIEILRTRSVRIASDRDLPLALDGEDGGTVGPRGIELAVRPAALRIVAPWPSRPALHRAETASPP